MADKDCCKVVGSFPTANLPSGLFSISISSSTEISKAGDELIVGATIGNVSISGYAGSEVHRGCTASASVSLNWINKFDCDNDEMYFIFGGAGKSSIIGDVKGLATIVETTDISYDTVSANSNSGPATLYSRETQEDGYGLSYPGGPIPFITDDVKGVEISNFLNIGTGPIYLQSFNLSLSPGQLPTATYSFVFRGDNK